MAPQYYEGVGRRKTSTARVRIVTGNGKFLVNDKPVESFFTRVGDIDTAVGPIRVASLEGRLDVSAKVRGGGVTGQTAAVCQGLARALVSMDAELRTPLRSAGFLTRDARAKERKKPGLKRARKAPTYTKR